MSKTTASSSVWNDRDASGSSTPVGPDVAIKSNEAAAATLDSREALAAYAHEAWSGWMRYLFTKCHPREMPKLYMNPDGSWIIPGDSVERWKRQMDTAYADLPESEKESDRAEADKMLALMSMAAASRDEDIRELVDDLLEVLLTNVERRMRLQGTTTDAEILAAWQPYEVSIRARLERMLTP